MTRLRIGRFKQPSLLKKISPDLLRNLFRPHVKYLKIRGLDIDASHLDYDRIGAVLANPDENFPSELVEALEICEAVSAQEFVDELIAIDNRRPERILGPECSNGDVVLLSWRHDPESVERIANKAVLGLDRTLCVYRPSQPLKHGAFAKENIAILEHKLKPYFEQHHRGPSCRVLAFDEQRPDYALLIKRGDPIHKTGTIDDNGDGNHLVFRPECIDLAYYDASRHEWRISGRAKWQQTTYAMVFASVFHEAGCHLVRSPQYTLAPLLSTSLGVLAHPAPDVTSVRLTEFNVGLHGANVRLSGRSLGQAFGSLAMPLVEFGFPKSAEFAFKLANRRTELKTNINEGRGVVRGDIDEPAIENWLASAGFIITEPNESEVLESH